MTTRREAERIFFWFMTAAVLMLVCIIGMATYLTLNPPPPIKFTPPAIWSDRLPADGPAEYEI